MDALPGTIGEKTPEIAVDRALGREILGQIGPGTAVLENIEDAVHNRAQIRPAFAPAPRLAGKVRRDQRELTVRHIACVTLLAPVMIQAGERGPGHGDPPFVLQTSVNHPGSFHSTLNSRTGSEAFRYPVTSAN